MTGYARKWNCSKCGKSCESIDWPKDELCESCAPQPDESEAVKLRELLHEAITLIGRWGALPMGSIPPVELTHNSAKFALRGAIALSNTPEVDNAE